jgi:hypothetical protein
MTFLPPVLAIAGARIEEGQQVMISPDGTIVPHGPAEPPATIRVVRPQAGQNARVTFDGLIIGSDPYDPDHFLHFMPKGPGHRKGEIWCVPIERIEVLP